MNLAELGRKFQVTPLQAKRLAQGMAQGGLLQSKRTPKNRSRVVYCAGPSLLQELGYE